MSNVVKGFSKLSIFALNYIALLVNAAPYLTYNLVFFVLVVERNVFY